MCQGSVNANKQTEKQTVFCLRVLFCWTGAFVEGTIGENCLDVVRRQTTQSCYVSIVQSVALCLKILLFIFFLKQIST